MAGKPYLLKLNGLRALAAFWILLFHLQPQMMLFFGSMGFVGNIFRLGYLGVDLFFVLSGFLIGYAHFDTLLKPTRKAYSNFLRARLLRLYPLHLAMLLAVLAMVVGAHFFGVTINNPDDYTARGFIEQILLISAWKFPAEMTWNHFAWFVSAIWLVYVLAPIFVRAADRAPKILLVACALLTPVAAYLWPQDSKVAYAIFRAIGGFGIGMALYKIFDIAVFKWLPAWLEKPFFQYWGNLSYALYITQFVTFMAIKKTFPPEIFIDTAILIKSGYLFGEIVLVLLITLIAHYLTEKPTRQK